MLWTTTSAAGLLLPQDLPLCTARHRHKSPCIPWILLGLCRTSKAASRAWLRSGTQGQALSRRRLGGAKYRSNERNRVCMGVQGSSTEWWTVQEQSQSWVCRGKGRHVHTVSHSPFFPVRLQEQQSHYCTKHRQKHGPLCRISHARSQWAPPCTSCFADSGQQLVASSLRLQHG